MDASPNPAYFLCAACDAPVFPSLSQKDSVSCGKCRREYLWNEGVLLVDASSVEDDYPSEVYDLLVQVEPRHFWFKARNQVILAALRATLGDLNGRSVLDIGCGTGFVMQAMEAAGLSCCGLDMHMAGLRYARGRVRGLLLCQPAARMPFKRQFDMVCLCDVIEHVDDDIGLLQSATLAVKDDGAILVTVPAQPSLWTHVDEAWGHKRRYTKAGLRQAMEAAGLQVRLIREFNILLYPLQALQRHLVSLRSQALADQAYVLTMEALRPPPAALNLTLGSLAAADFLLGRLPFLRGTSLVAIASPR